MHACTHACTHTHTHTHWYNCSDNKHALSRLHTHTHTSHTHTHTHLYIPVHTEHNHSTNAKQIFDSVVCCIHVHLQYPHGPYKNRVFYWKSAAFVFAFDLQVSRDVWMMLFFWGFCAPRSLTRSEHSARSWHTTACVKKTQTYMKTWLHGAYSTFWMVA